MITHNTEEPINESKGSWGYERKVRTDVPVTKNVDDKHHRIGKRDTFLTRNTTTQVHKDVRPISSDCETFPLENQEPNNPDVNRDGFPDEQVRGPRVVDTGKDVLGRPYDEVQLCGEMNKTYSPAGAGGLATARNFSPAKPGAPGTAKAGTFKPTKP